VLKFDTLVRYSMGPQKLGIVEVVGWHTLWATREAY